MKEEEKKRWSELDWCPADLERERRVLKRRSEESLLAELQIEERGRLQGSGKTRDIQLEDGS